jgi:hypothetical protein
MIRCRIFWSVSILTLLMLALPYVLAAQAGGDQQVFGGFLMNLADGNSYLAKMQQGWQGEWRFRLPFTAEPGQGAYLFGFYLFLGHLARWLGVPLLIVFHAARLMAAIFLLIVLRRFYEIILAGNRRAAEWAWCVAALGGGMGWLVALMGGPLTADFWVAETYPFLSMYANPHFPLGLACMLEFLNLVLQDSRSLGWMAILGLVTGIVLPFGVVVIVVVLGGAVIWQAWVERRLRWREVVAFGLPGGGVILYQFVATLADPVLRVWNAQNQTPSPPVWDVLIALMPVALLALPGSVWWWKQERNGKYVLFAWVVMGVALMYAPFSLQRRFMLGFFVPLIGLAAGWFAGVRNRWVAWGVLLLSLPTSLLIVTSGVMAGQTIDEKVYVPVDVMNGMNWLKHHATSKEVVLASPELGLLLPGWSGCRVIYGHPFETANAEQERLAVEAFFALDNPQMVEDFLVDRKVAYVFWERGPLLAGLEDFPIVFESGEVKILRVESGQR